MLLSAEHISLNFGLKQLLDDVTLYLNEGDKIGIIGINGTGKSSFLRVLAGQQVPDSGAVSRDPNVQVCFLSQNPKMDPEATVLEQVFSDFSPDTRALMEYEAKAMLTRLGITWAPSPAASASAWPSPPSCSTRRMSSSWTSRRTTWTATWSSGWKTACGNSTAASSWSPTTATS